MQPFDAASQLVTDLDPPNPIQHLPGYPNIHLNAQGALHGFLRQDFDLGDLAQLAPKLWMMSKHDHANISALHRQKVKGREIVITEDPRLHLVWYRDRIFIKPLPRYLLSAVFWRECFSERNLLGEQRRAALGYLRTYAYLICYESDFRIAKRSDLYLVPEHVSWQQFCIFKRDLNRIPNDAVAERYHYGEIRLSRLNFYCKIFLRKQHFQRMQSQYGTYFARFYAPFLFIFGALSLILSAMQVELATEALSERWRVLWSICRYFSVITLATVTFLFTWLAWLLIYKFCKEWHHALRHRYESRQSWAR